MGQEQNEHQKRPNYITVVGVEFWWEELGEYMAWGRFVEGELWAPQGQGFLCFIYYVPVPVYKYTGVLNKFCLMTQTRKRGHRRTSGMEAPGLTSKDGQDAPQDKTGLSSGGGRFSLSLDYLLCLNSFPS